MAAKVQPLGQKFQITNEDGTPTEYFIRWAQQRQIDIASADSREIIAGTGLDGGGVFDTDITIDANASAILDLISPTQGTVLFRGASSWQGLAPGTSGNFLKTNGTGADPAWAAASAAVGHVWGFSSPATSVSTSVNSTKGFNFQVSDPITIDTIAMCVDGHGVGTPVDYTLRLVTVNNLTAAGTISSILGTSSAQTVNVATGTVVILTYTLASPVSLSLGTNYGVLATASVATARVRHNSAQNVVMAPLLNIAYRGLLQTVAPTVGSAYAVGDVFSGAVRTL